jgi:predicted RNA binding protein YcfA (HicA-like mRNA interferase family)
MKLPRDLGASDLIKALARLGYTPVRQTGSHIRLQTHNLPSHSITVPNHDPLKIGTLAAILGEIGRHHGLEREALTKLLFED